MVPKGRRFKYLIRQAGIMRNQGLEPAIIRVGLDIQAVKKCEDGQNFIVSHKTNLDALAGWSADWKEGDYAMRTIILNGEVLDHRIRRFTRHDLLTAAARTFPDRIESSDVYDAFEAALDGTGYTLNRNSGKHQSKATKVMKEAGFVVERPNGVCTWVKTLSVQDTQPTTVEENQQIYVIASGGMDVPD